MKFIRDFSIIILITVICCEMVVRLFGYTEYKINLYTIQSEPKLCLIPHSELGFSLNPGTYHITVNDQLIYSVTHNSDSSRITQNTKLTDTTPRRLIDIHGCSFSYGWGVNDTLSYPFLLQNALPEWGVRNLAVPGYGNLQALVILEKQIADGMPPNILILNYATFHDERNALTPNYRQGLKHGFEKSNSEVPSLFQYQNFPFCSIDQNGNLEFNLESWRTIHRDWPLRKVSALVNFFQYLTERNIEKQIDKRRITQLIIEEIQKKCLQHDIHFILTGMTSDHDTSEILEFAEKLGVNTLPMGIDLDDLQYNNMPYDSHPNAVAHAIFAKRVLSQLPIKIIK